MKLSSVWPVLARQFCSKTFGQQLQSRIHQIRFASQHMKPISTEERELCYTLPNGNFTMEQRQFYEENGYIIIRKLTSSSVLEQLQKRLEDICAGKVRIPGLVIMKDVVYAKSKLNVEEKTVNRIMEFTFDDELFKYCCIPELVQYVENFTGPNITAMHTMFINKPPDAGQKTSRHPYHQDAFVVPCQPINRIVGVCTAIDHAYRENGCLAIFPGSHKGKLERHVIPNWKEGINKLFYGIENFDPNREKLYVEMWEGDTIFFHPLLIHGSGTNQTSGFRRMIACHFADSTCHYMQLKDFQGDMAKGFTDTFRKRTGRHDATFIDLWKHRSRVVKGKRINL